MPVSFMPVYVASKYAVVGFTKSLAVSPLDIIINQRVFAVHLSNLIALNAAAKWPQRGAISIVNPEMLPEIFEKIEDSGL